MFRILQTLEREPQEDLTNQLYDTSPAPGRTPFVRWVLFTTALMIWELQYRQRMISG